MQINPISITYANGVLSLTSKEADLSEDFDTVVREIQGATLRVDPYIVQNSKYEKIPGTGLNSYLLVPPGGMHSWQIVDGVEMEIDLIEKIVPEEELIEEIDSFMPDDETPYVVLVDGTSYGVETITHLPNLPNIFVLFSPYRTEKTLPVIEAKSLVQKKVEARQQGTKVVRVKR